MSTPLQHTLATATVRNFRAVAVDYQADPTLNHWLAEHHCYWSDATTAPPDSRPFQQYRQVLGMEHQLLGLDLRQNFHANACLALLGTLQGGGLLILQVPAEPAPMLQRFIRVLEHLQGQELLSYPSTSELLYYGRQYLTGALQTQARPFIPTTEQQTVLRQLDQWRESTDAVLNLTAPRGRGKSATLGHWLGQLPAEMLTQVQVCAPSKRQLATLTQHCDNQQLTFVPPDQLLDSLADEQLKKWVVIDEAADLPGHVLQRTVERTQKLILATTTEGYEQAGRSYAVKLTRQLPNHFARVFSSELAQPIRWAAGDPLESACREAFLLSGLTGTPASEPATGKSSEHYLHTHASRLSEPVLNRAFQLLHQAHYQTSPNDLKLLLDDPAQRLVLQYRSEQLTGLVWLASEGPIEPALNQAIQQGRRRPPGNLLPQALSYFLQCPQGAALRWGRVVRIAVSPDLQGRGLGSRLLAAVERQPHGYTGLGTSFGATPELTRFWLRNGYRPVRLGARRDAASGQHALLLLKPQTPCAADLTDLLASMFQAWWPWQGNLRTVSPALYSQLCQLTRRRGHRPARLTTEWCQRFLSAFATGQLHWPVAKPAIAYLLWQQQLSLAPAQQLLLHNCAWSAFPLTELAKTHAFPGANALVQELRAICQQVSSGSTNTGTVKTSE